MLQTFIPDFFIPFQAAYSLLQDAASRDRTTARRTALVEILWHERYLSRENLMARVEDRLGGGCFGDSAWEDTFNRDMLAVKEAFALSDSHLVYSRKKKLVGYYLRGDERLHPHLRKAISAAVHEIDVRQLGIYHSLGLVQRIRQALFASEQERWGLRYARGSKKEGVVNMTLAQFIRRMTHGLTTSGIMYAIIGTAAGWVWGEPRPAQELDLLVELRAGQNQVLSDYLQQAGLILTKDLPAGDADKPQRSVRITALHTGSDLRVNLTIPHTTDHFLQTAFQHTMELNFGRETGAVNVLSPEYLILLQLLEYSADRQPGHLRAIAAVYFNQGNKLDHSLIRTYAEKKGWMRVWEEIADQAAARQP